MAESEPAVPGLIPNDEDEQQTTDRATQENAGAEPNADQTNPEDTSDEAVGQVGDFGAGPFGAVVGTWIFLLVHWILALWLFSPLTLFAVSVSFVDPHLPKFPTFKTKCWFIALPLFFACIIEVITWLSPCEYHFQERFAKAILNYIAAGFDRTVGYVESLSAKTTANGTSRASDGLTTSAPITGTPIKADGLHDWWVTSFIFFVQVALYGCAAFLWWINDDHVAEMPRLFSLKPSNRRVQPFRFRGSTVNRHRGRRSHHAAASTSSYAMRRTNIGSNNSDTNQGVASSRGFALPGVTLRSRGITQQHNENERDDFVSYIGPVAESPPLENLTSANYLKLSCGVLLFHSFCYSSFWTLLYLLLLDPAISQLGTGGSLVAGAFIMAIQFSCAWYPLIPPIPSYPVPVVLISLFDLGSVPTQVLFYGFSVCDVSMSAIIVFYYARRFPALIAALKKYLPLEVRLGAAAGFGSPV